MSKLICMTCLKYPICISKEELTCVDLINWFWECRLDTDKFANRINSFEAWWDREVSVLSQMSFRLAFKKQKDCYSTLIVPDSGITRLRKIEVYEYEK